MRFLYITTIGSTMGFFPSLIRNLLDAGHDVDIATNEDGGEKPVPPCFREWGCKVYPISCSRSPLAKGNLRAIFEIRGIVSQGNYDIVHCHTPIAAACTRIACKGLRKSGVKVIYTAHGFHFYTGAPLKNWLLFYPVEWLCAHWTDVLITINQEDYARAKKHMHAKRVEYVPGVGIDVKRFMGATVDRAAKRREIGVPEDAILLLSVGELNDNKNHATVIRALAKVEDANIHYAIAGNGPLKETLEALAKSLGVGGQLHLLGYRRDVAELYKAADICVFPSIREGQGLAALEGMASGLPLIASDNRGTRDILIQGKNALICRYNDVEGFAEAIQEMASDPAKRETFGANNRVAAQNYDLSGIQPQLANIYADCSQIVKVERERERERERARTSGAAYPNGKTAAASARDRRANRRSPADVSRRAFRSEEP